MWWKQKKKEKKENSVTNMEIRTHVYNNIIHFSKKNINSEKKSREQRTPMILGKGDFCYCSMNKISCGQLGSSLPLCRTFYYKIIVHYYLSLMLLLPSWSMKNID